MMNWFRRNWTPFSILILAISLSWMVFLPPSPEVLTGGRIPAPREGFLAPDFTLQDEQGQAIRLSDLRGRPVLVNLWASWCPPCQAEMPDMEKAYEKYSQQGFIILAINTTYQDQKSSALAFASQHGLTFPILFDMDGTVSHQYMVRAMPTSFFIDQQGIIRRVIVGGPMAGGLLSFEIEKMLREKQ
jgi:cytochrome c biogenesis protein CcmG, thiol:disulfide interchange protein DsbE